MTRDIPNCVLELDDDRGVLYVHHPNGFTVLRICGLPHPFPEPSPSIMLDITLKFGKPRFSWEGTSGTDNDSRL